VSLVCACPLCHGENTHDYYQGSDRDYLICDRCALVFVPPRFHVTAQQERQRYDQHQNSPDDLKYRAFLSRLLKPLLKQLQPDSEGIDFASGPAPTLSVMLQEQGFSMSVYDLFYANNRDVLDRQYDFLCCTEAIEHFAAPDREWQRFLSMVKSGGWIAIMTSRYDKVSSFSDWYYKNDSTHISFYSQKTFQWLAARDNLEMHIESESVVLFRIK